MPKHLRESLTLTEATPNGAVEADEKGILPLRFITPGWGSSGYYSRKVLENAAQARVFPAGTRMFLDHPTETEQYDRPERSVRDLVAVFESDAVWDGSGLAADAKVFGPFRDMFRDLDFVNAIGVSIRASAQVTTGEAEGRKGQIITELIESESVDFVTQAGRGGKVLAVLESARAGIREALTADVHELLNTAVRAAFSGPGSWAFLRDYDPDAQEAIYGIETETASALYRDGYTIAPDGLSASLAGSPVEVRARTEYVPLTSSALEESSSVPAPAGQSITPQTSEEDNMGTIQIEESVKTALEAEAGRVPELVAERDAAVAELAAHKAREKARPIVEQVVSESTLPASTKARVTREALATVPTKDDGTLDEDAVKAAAESARTAAETELAEVLEAAGAGQVRGFGASTPTPSGAPSVEDFDAAFRGTTSQEG